MRCVRADHCANFLEGWIKIKSARFGKKGRGEMARCRPGAQERDREGPLGSASLRISSSLAKPRFFLLREQQPEGCPGDGAGGRACWAHSLAPLPHGASGPAPAAPPPALQPHSPDLVCGLWVHLNALPKEHRQHPGPHLKRWGVRGAGRGL